MSIPTIDQYDFSKLKLSSKYSILCEFCKIYQYQFVGLESKPIFIIKDAELIKHYPLSNNIRISLRNQKNTFKKIIEFEKYLSTISLPFEFNKKNKRFVSTLRPDNYILSIKTRIRRNEHEYTITNRYQRREIDPDLSLLPGGAIGTFKIEIERIWFAKNFGWGVTYSLVNIDLSHTRTGNKFIEPKIYHYRDYFDLIKSYIGIKPLMDSIKYDCHLRPWSVEQL